MDQISGQIEKIIFKSEKTGFVVAILKDNKKNSTYIVGSMPSINVGENITCQGRWTTHKKYGKQFLFESYIIKAPSDIVGIKKYLESGFVKGIGPKYAKNIVDKFKEETLEVLDKFPDKLLEVDGIGKKRLKIIISCWEEKKEIRDVMIFLRSLDISSAYAQKIYRKYGSSSISKVKENPYQLARDISGIGFKMADLIAMKMGFLKFSKERIEAGIEHTFFEIMTEGHTCFLKDEFIILSSNILDIEQSQVKEVLSYLIETDKVVEFSTDEKSFISLILLYDFEKSIAKNLFELKKNPSVFRKIDIEKALSWVQKKLTIKLEDRQKEAVAKGISEKVSIITGGPGTGKSTITRAILEITKMLSNDIVLAAPTGRAAKRLAWITRKKAFTIHALLEYDFISGTFKRDLKNPLKADLVIIDEASMVDTYLMYNLLQAIPKKSRLIFVGDIDQLPSVGPGYILKDMILSEKIEVTRLKKIFRQAKNSKIITNAHRINMGLSPDLKNSKKGDFIFIEKEDPIDIQKKILELVFLISEKYKIKIDDIQVLAPMKKGIIGTETLNELLQKKINPSKNPLVRGDRSFHLFDKVMQIKNNYNKNIFNGDIGKITKIDLSTKEFFVTFDRKVVTYNFLELDEIVLAYAVSVHKYQGSECPCVIMPIHTTHFKLLQRNLLYTAITRGKKLITLVGTKKALFIAIRNNSALKRYTGLKKAIEQHSPLQATR